MTAKVVNCNDEPFDIYIGRGSSYGNPFSHREGTMAQVIVESREEAIKCFENYLLSIPALMDKVKAELRGKILGCHCKPLACHGDILLKYANEK